MRPEISVWLAMFNLIKSETLKGCAPAMLRRAKAADLDYEIFLSLESIVNNHRLEKANSK